MKNQFKLILLAFCIISLNSCVSFVSNMMMDGADLDKDEKLTFAEYKGLMESDETTAEAKTKGMTSDEYLKKEFDRTDSNNDGFIEKNEFKQYVKEG